MSAAVETPRTAVSRWATFSIEGERYAVESERVMDVLAPCGVTRVPGASGWVSGVKESGGLLVTVVDLRPLFGLAARSPDTGSRILVVAAGALRLGLLVDGLGETLAIDAANVEPLPHAAGSPAARVVQGLWGGDQDLVALLDLEALVEAAQAAAGAG